MEANNLPEVKFKTLVLRMLKELRRKMGKFSENFNRDNKH